MIDINRPNMQPLNDIFNNIVNACESNNIIMTMVNGKIVYKDEQYYCNVDYHNIVDHCNKIIARIDAYKA
jgi:5-methylthioadenosine/S-adenosylhomocysteine deaminase